MTDENDKFGRRSDTYEPRVGIVCTAEERSICFRRASSASNPADRHQNCVRANIASRNTLGPTNRRVVPFTSFSEYETGPGGKKVPVWFALGEDRPLACFAGIWTNWTSVRKATEGEFTCDIFAFLPTEANAEVAPIHPKAMPVILTEENEVDVWLNAPTPVAKELQRPLPGGMLRIVTKGERADKD